MNFSNIGFIDWVKGHKTPPTIAFVFAILQTTFALDFPYPLNWGKLGPDFLLSATQAFFIIVFLIWLWIVANSKNVMQFPGLRNESRKIMRRDIQDFSNRMILIWFAWAVLYIIVALLSYIGPQSTAENTQTVLQYLIIVVNDFTAILFFSAFVLLAFPKSSSQSNYPNFRYRNALYVGIFIIFLIALLSLVTDLLLIKSPSTSMITTGLLSGLAMVMLVGRIDSKHIMAPVWLIVLLYFYALHQPIYSGFQILPEAVEPANQGKSLDNYFLVVMLIGKAAFFVFLVWIYETKKLSFFLHELRVHSGDIKHPELDPQARLHSIDERLDVFNRQFNRSFGLKDITEFINDGYFLKNVEIFNTTENDRNAKELVLSIESAELSKEYRLKANEIPAESKTSITIKSPIEILQSGLYIKLLRETEPKTLVSYLWLSHKTREVQ